jgi:hypothetical protein
MDPRASDADIIVPFDQGPSTHSGGGNALDNAGRAIVELINRLADKVEESNQNALDVANNLSSQLRAAEERVKNLEIDVVRYRDRAEQAEQRADQAEKWLNQISREIEQRFFAPADGRAGQASSRPVSPPIYARRR